MGVSIYSEDVEADTYRSYTKNKSWLVPSRPPVSLPEARLRVNSSPPRLPVSRHPPPEVSRSPIGTGPVPSPSVRSHRTSRLIFGSRALPSVPCRKLRRPTSLACLRTPTCAPSTPSVSPSCPRISSLPGGSVASVLKRNNPLSAHSRHNLLSYILPWTK